MPKTKEEISAYCKARYANPEIRNRLIHAARERSSNPLLRSSILAAKAAWKKTEKGTEYRRRESDRRKIRKREQSARLVCKKAAPTKGERNAKIRSRTKLRRETNPQFRTSCILRSRIRDFLEAKGKSGRTAELLGCSFLEFTAHLERQFKKGMTWENQGKYGWHIDHIRPCASFDMTLESDQRACFHFSNLRPLWAKANRAKGDKWDGQSVFAI